MYLLQYGPLTTLAFLVVQVYRHSWKGLTPMSSANCVPRLWCAFKSINGGVLVQCISDTSCGTRYRNLNEWNASSGSLLSPFKLVLLEESCCMEHNHCSFTEGKWLEHNWRIRTRLSRNTVSFDEHVTHKKHKYDLIHFLLRAEKATYWMNMGRFFFLFA